MRWVTVQAAVEYRQELDRAHMVTAFFENLAFYGAAGAVVDVDPTAGERPTAV